MIYIMRGIPGAGKDRWVSSLRERLGTTTILSADHFFLNEEGKYVFDAKLLPQAHDECLTAYYNIIRFSATDFLATTANPSDEPVVIVNNTNISAWEIAPYYRLAEIHKLEVKIIRVHADPVVAWQRNVHQVPLKVVLEMHQRLMSERLPPWWKEEIVL